MRVHPEMKEAMNAAMTEGLKHWRNKSPEQIAAKVKAEAYADSWAFMDRQKDIGYEVHSACKCNRDVMGNVYHYRDCERPTRIVFVRMDKPKTIDGREWFGNSIVYPRLGFSMFKTEVDNDDEK